VQAQELIYIPSLEFGVADGIYDIVDGIVGDIYKHRRLTRWKHR